MGSLKNPYTKENKLILPDHLSSCCLLYKYGERGLELRGIRICNLHSHVHVFHHYNQNESQIMT